jgi:hypothetical protein
MAKRKAEIKMVSYGEYSKWDRESKKIPKILHFTTEIQAKAGTEFGYVLHIRNGKGKTIEFYIEHPPFKGTNNKIEPPFTGIEYIKTNDFEFYIGDCIWEPIDDKFGKWEISTFYDGNEVARKTFRIIKTI